MRTPATAAARLAFERFLQLAGDFVGRGLHRALHDFGGTCKRLVESFFDGWRIISDPPMIVPVEEIFSDIQTDAVYQQIRAVLGKYRRSLQSGRRHLLGQFTLVQVARKVVGVGSVGSRAWIVLMDGGDGVEPLFLQAKEAQLSVLAGYCGRSKYSNQGERVVAEQHLMQAESDIFLAGPTSRTPTRWTATTTSVSCATGNCPCRSSGRPPPA